MEHNSVGHVVQCAVQAARGALNFLAELLTRAAGASLTLAPERQAAEFSSPMYRGRVAAGLHGVVLSGQ